MSQSINLGNIKTVRFNGTDMAEMKLNTSSIWVGQTELTISSNTNNYDIGAAVLAAGGDKATNVQLTINPGVTVGSTSSGTAAMRTGTGWGSGVSITIYNNGSIIGASASNSTGASGSGGAGGGGGGPGGPCRIGRERSGGPGGAGGNGASGSGNSGGNAFEHSQSNSNMSVIFASAGVRVGGSAGTYSAVGGGGGGGGGKLGDDCCCGGGGGGGASGGAGGPRNRAKHYYGWCTGYSYAGASGGATTGGSGGAGYGYCGGHGGNGGNLGSNGNGGYGGCGGYGPHGSGGAAGSSVSSVGTAGAALSGNTSQIS